MLLKIKMPTLNYAITIMLFEHNYANIQFILTEKKNKSIGLSCNVYAMLSKNQEFSKINEKCTNVTLIN